MIEVLHRQSQLTSVTYEAMQTGLCAAVDSGSIYVRTSMLGAWENITAHPEDISDVQYYYNMFMLRREDPEVGGRSVQVRGNIQRFEGVFRRKGLLRKHVDISPMEIRIGDKLALRTGRDSIGTSLKVEQLATGTEARDLLMC